MVVMKAEMKVALTAVLLVAYLVALSVDYLVV